MPKLSDFGLSPSPRIKWDGVFVHIGDDGGHSYFWTEIPHRQGNGFVSEIPIRHVVLRSSMLPPLITNLIINTLVSQVLMKRIGNIQPTLQ